MAVSSQFFLYYVFWPGVLGFILVGGGLLGSGWYWWSVLGWCLLWLIPPVGRYRRRFWLACHKEEVDVIRRIQGGDSEAELPGRLLTATVVTQVVMFLSLVVGTNLAVYAFHDRLVEEAERRAKGSGDQQTPEVSGKGSGVREAPSGVYGAFGDQPDDPRRWKP